MARKSGPDGKELLARAIRKYGNHCRACKRPGTAVKLVCDHWDNDNSNDADDNIQPLCYRCNHLKNPRGPGRPPMQRVLDEQRKKRPMSAEMLKNLECEAPWREWIWGEILKNGYITATDAVDGGAEMVGVSIVTIRQRWLPRMVSCKGLYEWRTDVDEDVLVFKDEYDKRIRPIMAQMAAHTDKPKQ